MWCTSPQDIVPCVTGCVNTSVCHSLAADCLILMSRPQPNQFITESKLKISRSANSRTEWDKSVSERNTLQLRRSHSRLMLRRSQLLPAYQISRRSPSGAAKLSLY